MKYAFHTELARRSERSSRRAAIMKFITFRARASRKHMRVVAKTREAQGQRGGWPLIYPKLLGTNRTSAMFAVRSLSGVNRAWYGQRISVENDPKGT
jgi:hypothetical protein